MTCMPKECLEPCAIDRERRGIDHGVEAEEADVPRIFIDDDLDPMLDVMHEAERRDRARREAHHLHQSLWRDEAEALGFEVPRECLGIHALVVHDDCQHVDLLLLGLEEELLGVCARDGRLQAFGLLTGEDRTMVVPREGDAQIA